MKYVATIPSKLAAYWQKPQCNVKSSLCWWWSLATKENNYVCCSNCCFTTCYEL